NRTISMSNKYFGGEVRSTGVCEPVDEDLKAVVLGTKKKVADKMEDLRVADAITDRKSTRLNSSHVSISYAVFCLKKKTTKRKEAQNVRQIRLYRSATAHRAAQPKAKPNKYIEAMQRSRHIQKATVRTDNNTVTQK